MDYGKKERPGQEEARRIKEMLERKSQELQNPDFTKELMLIISDDPFGLAAAEATGRSKKDLYQGKDRMPTPESMRNFLDYKTDPRLNPIMTKKFRFAPSFEDPAMKSLYQGKDRMRMPEDMPEFLDFKKKGGM